MAAIVSGWPWHWGRKNEKNFGPKYVRDLMLSHRLMVLTQMPEESAKRIYLGTRISSDFGLRYSWKL